jgi:hypothetical protein
MQEKASMRNLLSEPRTLWVLLTCPWRPLVQPNKRILELLRQGAAALKTIQVLEVSVEPTVQYVLCRLNYLEQGQLLIEELHDPGKQACESGRVPGSHGRGFPERAAPALGLIKTMYSTGGFANL